MNRGVRCTFLAAAALAALCGQAWADEGDWGDGIEVMQDAEMADHRGGLDIGGIAINFGAVVTTYVNGVPALTTTLTWTDLGAFIEETVGDIGQNINAMTPAELEALGLDGLENGGGIVIDDADGVTALVHNVTGGTFQNIIINSATGRDLAQEVDVTLELPGFELIQNQLLVDRFGLQITDDMRGIMFSSPGG